VSKLDVRNRLAARATAAGFESSRAHHLKKINGLYGSLAALAAVIGDSRENERVDLAAHRGLATNTLVIFSLNRLRNMRTRTDLRLRPIVVLAPFHGTPAMPTALSSSTMEILMETILIVVLLVLLLGGGGWYGHGRWYGRRPL
jgi:hypothetical protein